MDSNLLAKFELVVCLLMLSIIRATCCGLPANKALHIVTTISSTIKHVSGKFVSLFNKVRVKQKHSSART